LFNFERPNKFFTGKQLLRYIEEKKLSRRNLEKFKINTIKKLI